MPKMVKPKKYLGQHFLIDKSVSQKVASVLHAENCKTVIEIGAGTGALSEFLMSDYGDKLRMLDVDSDSIDFLKRNFPEYSEKVLEVDFLKANLREMFDAPLAVVGNFPYNISTQIVFKILENRDIVPEWAGMFQKEVADRICSENGSKVYGILSVLVQAYYEVKYEFTISPHVFNPPPKVKSAVMTAKRYRDNIEDLDDALFFDVVKTAFNQRRKTLSNALKKYVIPKVVWEQNEFAKLRAEQLNVDEFIALARFVSENR
jgi:16S rRNA (adenine1518-N6/adenine1519-N6)-dimethyltransferase